MVGPGKLCEVYGWRNTNLKEISLSLIEIVEPQEDIEISKLVFRSVSATLRGKLIFRNMGRISPLFPGKDDNRKLLNCDFNIGDLVDVSVYTPRGSIKEKNV